MRVLLGFAAVVAVGCTTPGDGTTAATRARQVATTVMPASSLPPTTVATAAEELPALLPEEARSTQGYLGAAGRPLLQLGDIARLLAAAGTASEGACDEAIGQLSTIGSPTHLAALATGIRDDVLAVGFQSVIAVTDEYLTRCRAAAGVPADVAARLRDAIGLLDARLESLP